MAHKGSYKAETFAVGLDHEIRRLNAQVDLFWREEQDVLARAGLRDGMDVLDCGCGPGRLIELMASQHDINITGLEIDPTLVLAAKDYLERTGVGNCRVVQGSAESPGLPQGSFDFIVMRLVLEHLVDPVVALTELKKLLRPGGRIVVISNDFANHLRTWPDVPELDELYDAYIANRRADGGDPTIGRHVPTLLRQVGFRLAGFEIEAAHNHLEGDPAFLLAEGAGIPAQLVEAGYLSEDAFKRLVASWRAMLQHPDHTMVRQLYIGVGENSDAEDTIVSAAPARAVVSVVDLEYVAPTTRIERDITRIWAEVIGLERVGVNQNFFDLGGTSLMLEHVQIRLEEILGTNLPLTLLFQHPTAGALGASIEFSSTPQARTGDTEIALTARANAPTPASQHQDGEAVSKRVQRRRDAMMRKPNTSD